MCGVCIYTYIRAGRLFFRRPGGVHRPKIHDMRIRSPGPRRELDRPGPWPLPIGHCARVRRSRTDNRAYRPNSPDRPGNPHSTVFKCRIIEILRHFPEILITPSNIYHAFPKLSSTLPLHHPTDSRSPDRSTHHINMLSRHFT